METPKKDRLKVMHVTESFGAGIFTVITSLSNVLAKEGFDVSIAFSMRDETPKDYARLLDPGVTFFRLSLCREIRPLKDFKGLCSLMSLLLKHRPDVVHLHSSKAGALGRMAVFLYKATGRRPRVFYSPHGFSFLRRDIGKNKRTFYRIVEGAASRLSGTIVACSRGEAEEASNQLDVDNAIIVENAIDLSSIPLKKRRDGRVLIGTTGRITPQKNPALFARIAKRIKWADFVWIGGGDYKYEREIFSVRNITVTGWLDRQKALERMASLDIYLQTSLWEGMPVSVIEAMGAGIPPVVTDIVGNRDVVKHGVCGYVASREEEFTKYLQALINDPELRLKMGNEAREVVKRRFNIERLVKQYMQLYRGRAGDLYKNEDPV